MAAPAFRAAGTAVYTANSVVTPTALTPTKSGSTVNGDMMILVTESIKITATCATPTGWVTVTGFPVTSATASGGRIYCFARYADGGANDAPTVTWSTLDTGTGGSSCGARILSFTECLLDQAGTRPTATDTAATTSFVQPGLTTTVDNAMVIGVAMRVHDTAHTFTITTFTERHEGHTATGTGHGTEVSSLLKTPAGATGNGTVTPSNTTSSRVLAQTVALAGSGNVAPIVDGLGGLAYGFPAGLVTVGQSNPPQARADYGAAVNAIVGAGVGQLLDECWDQVPNTTDQHTRVRTSYNPFDDATTRSFGIWVNRDAVNSSGDLLLTSGGDTFGREAGLRAELKLQGTGGNDIFFTPATAASAGVTWSAAFPGSSQWVFVGLVYNQSTGDASLYINGTLVSTQAVPATNNWGGTAPNYLTWGGLRGATSTSIDGKLYGAFVYEGAVTATQWAQLFEAPPVPGGGTAGGNGPTARVPVPQGGAVAGGVAPGEVTVTTETPTPGGALAGGSSPTARVSVAAGGALGAGTAPGAIQTATPTPGGALAGGSGPVARVAAAAGGALAGAAAPLSRVSAPQGGATAQGAAPTAQVPVAQGGAPAGGLAPAEAQSAAVTPGGGAAAGAAPAARVAVAQGGAQAGGNAPSESTATTETPVPGGAVAQGSSPTARATVSAGGAQAVGQTPTTRATVAQGGALGGGVGATARVTITAAGALAGGVAPTEDISSGDSVPAGGALAGGVGPGARVTVVIAGALAGGRAPAEVFGDIAPVGGALAAGRGPTARVALAPGGAQASGTEPFEGITVDYPAAVLEDEPALYWRLGEYV